MRVRRGITLVAVTAALQFACYKSTPATADSTAASSTSSAAFDKGAASAQILGNDSTFVRGMMTKNVDTVMCCYDNDAVSIGSKTVKGVSDLRKAHAEDVKTNPRDITFHSDGVNFSDDGSMAWDYGSYSQTADVKGKPTKQSGNFLNVWKRVDGKWKIVAEVSTPSQ
jgi:ketosteroid isomerase-like protein